MDVQFNLQNYHFRGLVSALIALINIMGVFFDWMIGFNFIWLAYLLIFWNSETLKQHIPKAVLLVEMLISF